jgi:peptidoglycan/xylan/chitin deacetylase (PgdA/CDA1 family)
VSGRDRVRRTLHRAEGAVTEALGTRAARAAAAGWRRGRCAVLCYHRVRPPDPFDDPSLVMAPERFAEHVALLAGACELVDARDALVARRGPRPRVAITFDDGYRELLEHALAPLAAHGAPATVFCCSEVVTGARSLWWDELEAAVRVGGGSAARHLELMAGCFAAPEPVAAAEALLDELGRAPVADDLYLGADDLARVAELGASVGSHAASHARLTALEPRRAAEELAASRAVLAAAADRPVDTVAYPYGDASAALAAAAREAGYVAGFTTASGLPGGADDPLRLPRVPVLRDDTRRRLAAKALGPQPPLYGALWRALGPAR